jgi:O-antigen/teichoic acid export membrane protein
MVDCRWRSDVKPKDILTVYGSYLLGFATSILTNFWLLRIVSGAVDKRTLGLYVTMAGVTAYLGLLQVGMDLAAAQRIIEALARNDPIHARRIYRQLRLFNRAAAGVCFVVSVLVALVCHFGAVADDLPVPILIATLGTSQAWAILARPSMAALIGTQRIAVVNFVRVGAGLATVILSYVLFRFGPGLVGLALADWIVQLAMIPVLGGMRRQLCPWTDGSVSDPFTGFLALVRYGIAVGGVSFLNLLESSGDYLLFQTVESGLAVAATYHVWLRCPLMALTCCSLLPTSVAQRLNALYAVNAVAGNRLYGRVALATYALAAASAFALSAWLSPFVRVWMTGRYDLPDGPGMASLLALVLLAKVVVIVSSFVLYPLGLVRIVLAGTTCQVVVKGVAGLVLLQVMSPEAAVALATVAGSVVAAVIYWSVLIAQRVVSVRVAFLVCAGFVPVMVAGYLLGRRFDELPTEVLPSGIATTGILILVVLAAVFAAMRYRSKHTPPPATGADGPPVS